MVRLTKAEEQVMLILWKKEKSDIPHLDFKTDRQAVLTEFRWINKIYPPRVTL